MIKGGGQRALKRKNYCTLVSVDKETHNNHHNLVTAVYAYGFA